MKPLPDRFAPATLSQGTPTAGASVFVSGFGTRDEQDGRGASTGRFDSVSLSVVEPYGRSRILIWLARVDGALSGACHGDSGGPISTAGSVFAITTWTTGPGKPRMRRPHTGRAARSATRLDRAGHKTLESSAETGNRRLFLREKASRLTSC